MCDIINPLYILYSLYTANVQTEFSYAPKEEEAKQKQLIFFKKKKRKKEIKKKNLVSPAYNFVAIFGHFMISAYSHTFTNTLCHYNSRLT